jgi:hypothetical protein
MCNIENLKICMPVIPALERWRQEDCELKTSPGYIVKPCLTKRLCAVVYACNPRYSGGGEL